MRWLVLIPLVACYEHHLIDLTVDARVDASRDASRDASPDVGRPLAPCASISASRPRLFSRTPPYDSTLGSIATTPAGVIVAAFTSSNDPIEMDVSRWIMPLDPTTGAPLLDDRLTVFGEPSGLTFVAHSHVTYPRSGEGIAYTWSTGQGCLVRPLDDSGQPLGGERRIASDACLSARYADRLYMSFRTAGPPQLAYVAELDSRFAEQRRVGPSRTVGDAFHWTWTVVGGDIWVAYADRDLALWVGRWGGDEPDVVQIEAANSATLPRFVTLGSELVLAWREGGEEDLRAAFVRVDSLESVVTPLGMNLRASWDLAVRGDEIWIAYAEGVEHRDARVAVARFTESFELRDTLRVGEERFPTRVRLETTPGGALVAHTGQRDDAEGGNQLFSVPVRCVAER